MNRGDESRFALKGFSDEEAFAEFYRRTSSALHGYVTRVTQDANVADDVLQMAYLRLLRAPPMDDSHRRAYLYSAATSIIIDRWRKMERERRHFREQLPSESYFDERERSIDLKRLLNELNGRERALLWLAYAEGFAHHEIAGMLGISQKSVKVMLFRVREKARKVLEPAQDKEQV